MVEIRISDSLAERLQERARLEQMSLDKYAENLLNEHLPELDSQPPQEEGSAPPGSFAAMGEAAVRANIHVGEEANSDRLRKLFHDAMEEHLTRWMSDDDKKQTNE